MTPFQLCKSILYTIGFIQIVSIMAGVAFIICLAVVLLGQVIFGCAFAIFPFIGVEIAANISWISISLIGYGYLLEFFGLFLADNSYWEVEYYY